MSPLAKDQDLTGWFIAAIVVGFGSFCMAMGFIVGLCYTRVVG